MLNDANETGQLFAEYEALHKDAPAPGADTLAQSFAEMQLTLTAESAPFSAPLAQLMELAPGVLLKGFSPTARFTLMLDRERLADVELVLVGEEFALRVVEIHHAISSTGN